MESRPLLQPDAGSQELGPNTLADGQRTDGKTIASAWRFVVLPLLASAFLHAMGTNIQEVTMSEFGESILCRNRFGPVRNGSSAVTWADTSKDTRCKGAEVQADLSMLQAVEQTFGVIPAILMSVLYGLMSDRFGRKPIMCLSAAGMLLLYAVDYVICAVFSVAALLQKAL